MTLTKQQDALATKLRDAGVPGVFAVLVASKHKYNRRGAKPKFAVVDIKWWTTQLESVGYWFSFNEAWYSEFANMEATGVRYDD